MMGISFAANSQQPESPDSMVYDCSVIDEKPEFPGGIEDLMRYLSENMRYPQSCYEAADGRVILQFIIDADGSVRNVEVKQSLDKDYYDNELVRVVMEMPRWTPGRLNGKNVSTWYMLPVQFRNIGSHTERNED